MLPNYYSFQSPYVVESEWFFKSQRRKRCNLSLSQRPLSLILIWALLVFSVPSLLFSFLFKLQKKRKRHIHQLQPQRPYIKLVYVFIFLLTSLLYHTPVISSYWHITTLEVPVASWAPLQSLHIFSIYPFEERDTLRISLVYISFSNVHNPGFYFSEPQ